MPINAAPSPAKSNTGYGGVQASAVDAGAPAAGVTGSGEELALTLEKIVSQLDIVSRTLQMLEQRASMNEEAVHNCLEYFKEVKEMRHSERYMQE